MPWKLVLVLAAAVFAAGASAMFAGGWYGTPIMGVAAVCAGYVIGMRRRAAR